MDNKFTAARLVDYAKSKLGCGYAYGTYGDICTPALRQRKAIQYPAQRYNLLNICGKWDGVQVFDCAGLIKGYLFAQLGIKYTQEYDKGATGMFRDWCAAKNGVWQTLPEVPGTLVFKGKPGNFPHVGIYIGGGQVIEAKSSREGVVQTTFNGGGWNYWGQPNIIDYKNQDTPDKPDAPVNPGTAPEKIPATIKRGSRGDTVAYAQKLLISSGYNLPKYGADGYFGTETQAMVIMFQKANGLAADGIIGKNTWTRLLALNTFRPGGRELKYIPDDFMRGDDVKLLQQKLKELNLYNDSIHGAFNAKTDTAVRRFQKLNGLNVNGVAGSEMWAALGVEQ